MTKNFCDICGLPADPAINDLKFEIPNGEKRREYTTDRGEGWIQRRIVTHPVFSFREHEKGFGGPPDLCRKCAADLLAGLSQKLLAGSPTQTTP